MTEQKLRKRDEDPLLKAIEELDRTNKELTSGLNKINAGAWSNLNSDHVKDALNYVDDPKEIIRMRRLGYYKEDDVEVLLPKSEKTDGAVTVAGEHLSAGSNRRLGVFLCNRERYEKRYKDEKAKRDSEWLRGDAMGEMDGRGNKKGFVPYNGSSPNGPPPGAKIEIEHEDYER